MKTFRSQALLGILSLALGLLALSASALAENKENKEENDKAKACSFCAMSTRDTPVLVLAVFKDKNGKEVKTQFDSVNCFVLYREKNKKVQKLLSAKVLDYETRDAKERKFIEIEKAYYVHVKKLKGTMPPYLLAFSTKSKASSFAEKNEGKVLSFSEAERLIMEKAGLMKAENHHGEAHNHEH